MQCLGFGFAMIPALRRLYPDRAEYEARLTVHTAYFNTQPYFASFILGATIRREEDFAAGRATAAAVAELKQNLTAPLGALGDSYFWGALKPLAAAVAVLLLVSGAWWAPLAFLALYNLFHLGLRLLLVFEGYRSGGDVMALMARFNFTRKARLFKASALAVTGALVGSLPAWDPGFHPGPSLPPVAAAPAALLLVTAFLWLMKRGATPLHMMLGLAAACLALAYGGLW